MTELSKSLINCNQEQVWQDQSLTTLVVLERWSSSYSDTKRLSINIVVVVIILQIPRMILSARPNAP